MKDTSLAEPTHDPLTLEVLQANVALLAEKERLEGERVRLLENEKLRNEFLARLSHDLRTPLNSIIGFSDLIIAGEGGKMNRKHAEFIAAINRNGHTLLAQINDLLDLSTLESKQMHLRRDRIALRIVLDDLKAATTPVLDQAGVKVVWPDVATTVIANLDRKRILQVLINLVDNARKFTPAGGTVSISMGADAEQIVFAVADTGPGIPADERERIFQPYYQRPNHMLMRGEGVGLGLVIVKEIVALHRGEIVIGGEAGKGCTFRITIPQAD